MKKLVSVIIPCFNGEKWLKEAINSCLNQTYPKIEIIVIDDGSTDNSLEIIKSYGEKVIYESGENRGGNHARNRGFALSSGEYIQYLDADDYILPEKIERQVRFLEETGADVVYGDWKRQYHLPDGKIFMGEINVCGPHKDFLEFVLKGKDPWLTTIVPLFKRDAVVRSGGWDENLKAVQDRDFYISVAISGAKCLYQGGCYSIHRKYGNVTVSTSNKSVWLENNLLLMEKAEVKLDKLGKLSTIYKKALAHSYFQSITCSCIYLDYYRYLELLRKTKSLDPDFLPNSSILKSGGAAYNLLKNIFGFLMAGIIYKFLKDLRYFRSLA